MIEPCAPDHLDALKRLVEEALAVVKARPPRRNGDEIRRSLDHVAAALERLRNPPPPSDSMIAVRDVCQFLMYRGEGLGREEFERKAGLPQDTFERLERAASKASDLDQIQNGIAAATSRLAPSGQARSLLTAAQALGKALAREFADAPEAAPKPAASALKLEDACRVVERLFRFDGASSIERATGVHRDIIEQMRSASVFFAKREGWGDIR